jgi:hypothetical protein
VAMPRVCPSAPGDPRAQLLLALDGSCLQGMDGEHHEKGVWTV